MRDFERCKKGAELAAQCGKKGAELLAEQARNSKAAHLMAERDRRFYRMLRELDSTCGRTC